MKLASLKQGRDGKLVLVSKDLRRAVSAEKIAPTLQAALDEWEMLSPRLEELSQQLEEGTVEEIPFDPRLCAAPLPRAYQWVAATAYVNHIELSRRARGTRMPDVFWREPMLHQGVSDSLLSAMDPIEVAQEEGWGIDFEAEIAVVLDDTPAGIPRQAASEHIRLVMLANDVSLRGLADQELAKGVGFYQSKPMTTFSPVAVTPDELGIAWDGERVHLPILTHVNGVPFGRPNAGVDMTFDFPTLISNAARTRNLCAGTVLGSGPVSNQFQRGPGKPVADDGDGFSCIAEQRVIETLILGNPRTPFLSYGDRIEIDMQDAQGRTIFGKIEQVVVKYDPL